MKKITCLILSFVLCLTMSLPVMAADKTRNAVETKSFNGTMSPNEITNLEQWVTYENANKTFSIKDGASKALTEEEYTKLQNCLQNSNYIIKNMNFSTGEVSVVAPGNKENISTNIHICSAYKNGKNYAKIYWWGVRFGISKSTINNFGAGVTLGGIWIPNAIASKVVSSLGVALGSCPGGIRFDINAFSFVGGVHPVNIQFQ